MRVLPILAFAAVVATATGPAVAAVTGARAEIVLVRGGGVAVSTVAVSTVAVSTVAVSTVAVSTVVVFTVVVIAAAIITADFTMAAITTVAFTPVTSMATRAPIRRIRTALIPTRILINVITKASWA